MTIWPFFRACIIFSSTGIDFAVTGPLADLFMIRGDINMIGFFSTPITHHKNCLLYKNSLLYLSNSTLWI
jgi:hypothetical protein